MCVVELDQEPKSKPSTSAAASSQVSLHACMWTSCSCSDGQDLELLLQRMCEQLYNIYSRRYASVAQIRP